MEGWYSLAYALGDNNWLALIDYADTNDATKWGLDTFEGRLTGVDGVLVVGNFGAIGARVTGFFTKFSIRESFISFFRICYLLGSCFWGGWLRQGITIIGDVRFYGVVGVYVTRKYAIVD